MVGQSAIIRVLLIEDNPADVRLFKEFLSEARDVAFDLEWAGRLGVGLRYLTERKFEVVLLDLGLPDSQGLETLRKVLSQVTHIPIVVLTGLDDKEIGLKAVQEGAQDYLIKGYMDSNLLTRPILYAIERKQAEEELRWRNRELSVLYTIDRAASQTLELEVILKQALEATLEALGIEAGVILLLDPDGETMTICMHRGLSDEFVSNVKHIQLGEGISGRAAAERKPVVLDVGDYPSERLAPYIIKEGFQTLASTPLISAGEVVGALNLATRRPRAFPPEEIELLTSIGRQLGGVVRNAQLYEAVQKELAERKKTAKLLRQERDISQKYLDVAGVMLVVLAKDQTVILINKKGCEILGYEEKEIFGRNWFDNFIPEKNREEVKTVFARLMAGEIESVEYYENPVLTKSGEEKIIAWHNASVKDEENNIIGTLSSGEDITERKQAEEELRKSEEKYRTLIDNIQDGVFIIQDGKMQYVNEAFAKTVGYKVEEVIGMDFRQLVAPEDLEMVADRYHRRQAGEDVLREYEFRVLHKDKKTRITVNMNVGLITYQGKIASMGTVKDITERKQLEAQLLHAQKLEAVGTLAGGIAHDFNNLLTAIMSNLELARFKLERGLPVEPLLEEIETVSNRAAELTNRLLAFSRRQIIQPVSLNLNNTITDMSKMLSRLIGEHITLELRQEGDLGMVNADPGQMEQVIMNLCVNARDAMPTGGKLILATHNIRLEGNYINNHPWVEKGDYVVLEVTDTGSGMDKDTKERIFEPFFTTKEVGKGTGLGLSMVYGIIKQHQGYIHVYSEPGRGTTFKIYLPRTEEEAAVAKVREAPAEVKYGQETILLAEDEDQLREAISNILEMFGYTVLLAQDGQEALETYERERERIDLVILDAVMPRIGGMEAADHIYKINPHQKILFSSGYSLEGIHEKFIIPPDMHFIQKPYNAKALARKIREILDK